MSLVVPWWEGWLWNLNCNFLEKKMTCLTNAFLEVVTSKQFMPREKLTCADGFKLSVQASEFHYCSPRDNTGPYTHVEIGFPPERIESIMPYIEIDSDEPTETVYPQVPVKIVNEIIKDHGGLALKTIINVED